MKAFDVRAYAISDFQEWYEDEKLELSPNFQRRSVWNSSAKAYLADTILQGKPFPKIILMQEFKEGRTLRVVVDGQQRLRAIFDFLADGIKVSRAHNKELAGKVFSQLPKDIQDEFLQYEIGCDVLNSAPLDELLDIFARINRYTVKLNAQEQRNAKYSGFFKTSAYELGYEYLNYWLESKILTPAKVTRMAEAEMASDLLGTFLTQIKPSKSIESYYKNFEDDEDNMPDALVRVRSAIEIAAKIYPSEEARTSAWSSAHMYYSLITCIGHIQKKFDNVPATTLDPSCLLKTDKMRSVLNGISTDYLTYSPQPMRASTPTHLSEFLRASTLATTDTSARITRIVYMTSVLESFF